MLVLQRYKGERIIIDGRITVEVGKIGFVRGQPYVKLCFDAPPDVTINREEVEEKLLQQCIDRSGIGECG